jgi:HK97 family phage prohead protease
MTTKVETRSQAVSFRSDSDSFELHGLVCPYDTPADIGGQFFESVMPGAFSRALREKQDVRALVNHDPSQVLGRVGNGTLVLSDSPEGLRCVIKLNRESQAHRDLFASVKRGDINQMSYGFKATPTGEKWEVRKGQRYRTLTDVDLFDCSAVTYPANKGTTVSARNAVVDGEALDTYHRRRAKELEYEILRNAPGYRITADLRVLPMSQSEVDARVDAENRLAAERIGQQIARDLALTEIENVKKELED